MDRFFYPKSLVIIGVSVSKINLGKIIVINNKKRGYSGNLYGIGSQEGDVEGVRIYKSLKDLPEVPDVAVIITPAETVPGLMRECGEMGIDRVVIESGGFSEFSHGDYSLETEVVDIAKKYGIKFIGPNCIGTVNFEINMMMPFAFFEGDVPVGSVSVISQSGGIGNTYMHALPENHIFLQKFVAVGNKLNLDEVDFTEYYVRDPKTDCIVEYLEGFNRGRAFFDVARTSDKPIIVQKSNRFETTARIAQSHTTALSASDDVVEASFYQSGVIRAEDEEEMIMAAKIMQLPPMRGRRVAVLSRSGGHAVISADSCAKYNFEIIPFPDGFIDRIRSMYHTRVIAHQNPLDLGEIFDYTIFIRILEEAIKLEEVDGILFNHLYQAGYESAMSRTFLDGVKELVEKYNKPVSMAIISNVEEIVDIAKNHPYPIYNSPLSAAKALNISADYYERRQKRDQRGGLPVYELDKESVRTMQETCSSASRIPLTDEALAVCRAAGLKTVPGYKVMAESDLDELPLKAPLVLKLISKDASHKTDVGGVRIGLQSLAEASLAIRKMKDSLGRSDKKLSIDGFLIQEMVQGGVEFFVGARQDEHFGPIVTVGLGGVFIEIFKDRSLRLAPVTVAEAHDMIRQLHSYPIIQGARGKEPLDETALVEVICRISFLMSAFPEISEIDLNPVILHPQGRGVSIVDARVFFGK